MYLFWKSWICWRLAISRGRLGGKITVNFGQFQQFALSKLPIPTSPTVPWKAAVHLFVEQLVDTSAEARIGERTLFLKYGGSVPWWVIAISNHRGATKDVGIAFHLLPLLQALSFWKWHPWNLKSWHPFLVVFFVCLPRSPFETQILKNETFKTTAYTEKIRKWSHMPRKRHELRNTGEDIKFAPQADLWHKAVNNNQSNTHTQFKSQQTLGKGKNGISRVTTWLDWISRAEQKMPRHTKKQEESVTHL